jgi:hypothetical protein
LTDPVVDSNATLYNISPTNVLHNSRSKLYYIKVGKF